MSYRAGFVGLIGQPNAGKSSLMNWLVRDKVSIVTAKPQTTRRRVLGLWSEDQGQIVFVDAPGLLENQKGLNAFLEKEAKDVIAESDLLLAVLSVDEDKKEDLFRVVDLVKASGKPYWIVVTKTDLRAFAHRRVLLQEALAERYPGVKVFWVSTVEPEVSEKPEELIQEILGKLPESPGPIYDPEILTPHSSRELAAELIREQCFIHLHQEIPYGIAVRISHFEEKPDLYRIFADLLVSREKHKPIVIGQKASVIKKISQGARQEMEKIFGVKVYLEVKATVRENWAENRGLMKELGYETSQ